MLRAVATLLLLCLIVACSSGTPPQPTQPEPSSPEPTPVAPSVASPPTITPKATPTPKPSKAPTPTRGIDVSHHQGSIDWRAVSGDRIDFAYLKATEGSTFTDPRFAENSQAADDAGLRVGAYHYFSLCSPGEGQGRHFASTMAAQSGVRLALPPAVDLELLGSCANPPEREALLDEVRNFIDVVEEATGQRVLVYSFPDFEERYGFSADLDRRQWVRRLGDRPPMREWWLWQRSQSASVDGIAGPVDLNVLRRQG